MHSLRLAASVASAIALLGVGVLPASATFHLMKVREVFGGATSDADAQYVVLQMFASGQHLVEGHELFLYDASGGLLETLEFPADVANGNNQAYILIATAAAESLFGVTADLQFTPIAFPLAGGAVCFESLDCVSWGNFSGTPSSPTGTPFNAGSGLALDQAIRRGVSAGSACTLESADDTNDSAADFDGVSPNPQNNSGEAPPPPAGFCAPTPAANCSLALTPAGSSLGVKNLDGTSKDQIGWKWTNGTSSAAQFGDPICGTVDYGLCIYDDGALVTNFAIPPGRVCNGQPCWKAKVKNGVPIAYTYKDKLGATSGITLIQFNEGVGKAKLAVKTKGGPIPPMPFASTTDVTMQLIKSDASECWQAVFPVPARADLPFKFSDKVP